MSAQSKTLPRCEYERTRDFLRNLWSDFSSFREIRKKNKEQWRNLPALGILTSDILKDFHPTELKIQSGMKGKPMLQTMRFCDWSKNKQWRQIISILKMEIPKQTNKENPTENIRSVSERWMDKIFENLSRAEQLERIAKSGYMDIDTFNNSFGMDQRIKDNMISSAKVEALNLMVMEFDTIEISGGDVLFSDTFLKHFVLR